MVTRMDSTNSTTQPVMLHNSSALPLDSPVDVLDVVTWLSCGLTCLSCLSTVLIYIGYRLLQSNRCMLRISFLTMLCTTEAFFVAGMKFTNLTVICTAMAAILHFSGISTFCWMLCYILFLGNELKGGHLSFFLFGMIGYMVPGCIVGISLIWHYTDYRDDRYCWISSENYLDWTLKAPMLTLTLLSGAILIHLLILMGRVQTDREKAVLTLTRSGVRACCVILPITSATWILGAFTVTDRRDHQWLQPAFTTCNLILGVVIFLFMCLFNGEVKEVRRIKQMGSLTFNKRKVTQAEEKQERKARRGINLIGSAMDAFRTQSPQSSPRRDHYRPLATSSSDLMSDAISPAAPLASVEDLASDAGAELIPLSVVQNGSTVQDNLYQTTATSTEDLDSAVSVSPVQVSPETGDHVTTGVLQSPGSEPTAGFTDVSAGTSELLAPGCIVQESDVTPAGTLTDAEKAGTGSELAPAKMLTRSGDTSLESAASGEGRLNNETMTASCAENTVIDSLAEV